MPTALLNRPRLAHALCLILAFVNLFSTSTAAQQRRRAVNARYLSPDDFADRFDIVTADVSFISLTKILPAIPPLLNAAAIVITLIKPQFEVGREEVGKGGIVRDEAAQRRVVEEITSFAAGLGMRALGVIDSPILGADGNREFLACFEIG